MKTVYIKRNDLFKSIDMLLCNNITSADESFIEDNFELFFDECDECKGLGEKEGKPCDECCGEGRHETEAYQYFLCRLDDYEKENLASYGVEVGYSEKLELHVLPIYDYGTSWSCFSYSKEVEDDYQLAHNETLTRSTVY
jgi:hypothetical protein